jgi:hypothetical protein
MPTGQHGVSLTLIYSSRIAAPVQPFRSRRRYPLQINARGQRCRLAGGIGRQAFGGALPLQMRAQCRTMRQSLPPTAL